MAWVAVDSRATKKCWTWPQCMKRRSTPTRGMRTIRKQRRWPTRCCTLWLKNWKEPVVHCETVHFQNCCEAQRRPCARFYAITFFGRPIGLTRKVVNSPKTDITQASAMIDKWEDSLRRLENSCKPYSLKWISVCVQSLMARILKEWYVCDDEGECTVFLVAASRHGWSHASPFLEQRIDLGGPCPMDVSPMIHDQGGDELSTDMGSECRDHEWGMRMKKASTITLTVTVSRDTKLWQVGEDGCVGHVSIKDMGHLFFLKKMQKSTWLHTDWEGEIRYKIVGSVRGHAPEEADIPNGPSKVWRQETGDIDCENPKLTRQWQCPLRLVRIRRVWEPCETPNPTRNDHKWRPWNNWGIRRKMGGCDRKSLFPTRFLPCSSVRTLTSELDFLTNVSLKFLWSARRHRCSLTLKLGRGAMVTGRNELGTPRESSYQWRGISAGPVRADQGPRVQNQRNGRHAEHHEGRGGQSQHGRSRQAQSDRYQRHWEPRQVRQAGCKVQHLAWQVQGLADEPQRELGTVTGFDREPWESDDQRSASVWMQRLKHNLGGDTVDPKLLLHDLVVCFDRHAAGQRTIRVRHIQITQTHELPQWLSFNVERVPQGVN